MVYLSEQRAEAARLVEALRRSAAKPTEPGPGLVNARALREVACASAHVADAPANKEGA